MMSLQFFLLGLCSFFACLGAKPVIRPGIQGIKYLSVKSLVVDTMKFECYEEVITSIMINVRWFINDIEILEAKYPNISPNYIDKALLLKYHWDYRFKLNMNVKCLIEFVNPGNPVPLQSHYSDNFVAGMVINNGDLDVTARPMETLRIPVKLTIPFVCNVSPSQPPSIQDIIKSLCGIRFEIAFPAYQNDNNCTQIDIKKRFFEPQPCGLHIKYKNWNQTQYVKIHTIDGDLYALQKLYFLGLNPLVPMFIDDEEGTWRGFNSPTVKILIHTNRIIKRKSRCEVINGMHISSFDGRLYRFNNTDGEYTIYSHNGLYVQINAFFWKCQLHQICVCGVAIRSMDSVFVANFCSEAGNRNMEKTICNIDDMAVQNSGDHVVISTKTGKITLNIKSSDNIGILIESSYSDFGMTSGFCGLLNDDVTDDMIPKGFVTPVKDTTIFTSSWSVLPTDSLFNSNRIKPLEIRVAPYCGCLNQMFDSYEFNNPEVECSTSESMNSCLFYDLPLIHRHCETMII